MNKQRKGFTLVELVVVIAIVGVFATLAVVALQKNRRNDRDSKRVTDIRQMQAVLELYFNDHQSYPTESEVVTGRSIISPINGVVYIQTVPSSPIPADTSRCSRFFEKVLGTSTINTYPYLSLGSPEREDCSDWGETCYSYALFFCLGGRAGGLNAGPQVMTPGGVLDYDNFIRQMKSQGYNLGLPLEGEVA